MSRHSRLTVGQLRADSVKIAGVTVDSSSLALEGLTASAAELNKLDGMTSSKAELNILTGVTATAAEINKLAGAVSGLSAAELSVLDGLTATTAELNKLAGTAATLTAAELSILDGVTATTAEINKLAGSAAGLTAAELSILDGVTAVTADLNLIAGVDALGDMSGVPRVLKKRVTASAGGVAQTTAICTLASGSMLHGVIALGVTPFNGDATKTLEVGITGNIDKYIDTSDFDPSASAGVQASMVGGTTNDQKVAELCVASTPIIATWTNSASASAGVVDVYVCYTPIA